MAEPFFGYAPWAFPSETERAGRNGCGVVCLGN
nr:MAG TPA: hypothetical protein [Caudoviricetes sp.]